MRTLVLGWLLAMLMATPSSVRAKPADAVISAAQVQPGADLNHKLEAHGWTVLGLPSDIYQPGTLFRPGSTTPEGSCVDATPITGDLPSIEAQGSKGFVVEGGAGLGTR